jgi:hypothetical protein
VTRLKEVYVVRTIDGHVVAFSRFEEEVRIYYPDNPLEKEMKISRKNWEMTKQYYDDSSDVGIYNDTVNAAWQCLGFMYPINKKEVKILNGIAGHYFPRIWRGVYEVNSGYCYNSINAREVYDGVYIGANVAASSIFYAVESLFKYVEPSKDNVSTFGHKIRETLILACTEVESAWRSILEANSSIKKSSYATSDYFSLVEPLRLKEWSVSLRDYPDLGSFSPFLSWDKSHPTKSLSWYDAYNAVKHHREERFKMANLGNLINAAAALHIMQSAQFGPDIYDRFFGNEKSPFFTVEHPVHDLSDIYVPDFVGGNGMVPDLYFK